MTLFKRKNVKSELPVTSFDNETNVSDCQLDDSLFYQHRVAIPMFVQFMLSDSRSKFDHSMVNLSLSRTLVKLVVEHVKACDKEVYDYFLPYINEYFKSKK